jgi:hypothetical protein
VHDRTGDHHRQTHKYGGKACDIRRFHAIFLLEQTPAAVHTKSGASPSIAGISKEKRECQSNVGFQRHSSEWMRKTRVDRAKHMPVINTAQSCAANS